MFMCWVDKLHQIFYCHGHLCVVRSYPLENDMSIYVAHFTAQTSQECKLDNLYILLAQQLINATPAP